MTKAPSFPFLMLVFLWLLGSFSVEAAEIYHSQVLFSMKSSVFGPPMSGTVDPQGNFYFLSASKSIVHVYDKSGKRIGFFHWAGAPKAHIEVDKKGNIVISSEEAQKVWVYDRSGKLLKSSEYRSAINGEESISFPKIEQYHFEKVLAKDKAGDFYVLYRFIKDRAVYHFQVSNTEDNPLFRTYKFDPKLKILCSFDSPILFDPVTQSLYGFRLRNDDQVEFLKWVSVL